MRCSRFPMAAACAALGFCLPLPARAQSATGPAESLAPATTSLAGWSKNFRNVSATFSEEEGGIAITVSGSKGARTDCDLSTSLNLVPGRRYRLSWSAKADRPRELVSYVLPWHAFAFSKLDFLTTSWQNYQYLFVARETGGEKPPLVFFVGHQDGKVWIKDLRLVADDPPPAPEPQPLPELEQGIARTLPAGPENDYRKIHWYTELSDAVREARKQNKPIYLWLMNGHPLCDT